MCNVSDFGEERRRCSSGIESGEEKSNKDVALEVRGAGVHVRKFLQGFQDTSFLVGRVQNGLVDQETRVKKSHRVDPIKVQAM
jgi:hypothetical protein